MATQPAPTALSLAQYVLKKELHRSGSGAVFEATELATGQHVALKRKDTPELGDRKLIAHEALLLERLSHPNVAVCLGSFVERGSFYMVLEFADSGDLGQLITTRHRARQHLFEPEIWGLFTQVCAGVACIHSQRIIHRDLKPRNVLLYAAPPPRAGRAAAPGLRLVAKIADLGVSRQLGDQTEMATTFYGTPLYISPELCRNQPYDAKTDVWSLGVILYELAALRPPFFGYSIVELAGSITRGAYDPLPASYSPTLHESVRVMLSTSPAQRPSVHEYCRWLQRRLEPAEPRARARREAAADPSVDPDSQREPGGPAPARLPTPPQGGVGAVAPGPGPGPQPEPEPEPELHSVAAAAAEDAHTRARYAGPSHQGHHAWSARQPRQSRDPGYGEAEPNGSGWAVDGRLVHDEGRVGQDCGEKEPDAEAAPEPTDSQPHRYQQPQEPQQSLRDHDDTAGEERHGVATAGLGLGLGPARPRTSGSSGSVMSARDRRLHERQQSYSARHANQIGQVQAASAGERHQTHVLDHAAAGQPQFGVSSQLARLRASMPAGGQHGGGSAADRPAVEGPPQQQQQQQQQPTQQQPTQQQQYSSSGGSSSGTSLVNRGYAAALGFAAPAPASYQQQPASAASLQAPQGMVFASSGYASGQSEIEVAGLPSHRSFAEYDDPSDDGADSAPPSLPPPPPPTPPTRPSTASSLRSPWAQW